MNLSHAARRLLGAALLLPVPLTSCGPGTPPPDLEAIPWEDLEVGVTRTLREVTDLLSIPTIGIGAGVHCDAQVLVMHDLLGLNDWAPSFVKQYGNLGAQASKAARSYVDEVVNRKFPDEEHSYR